MIAALVHIFKDNSFVSHSQRMDRAWYDLDSGYDDTNNPFANIPEEYTKKKEEKLVKTTVKRMSAQQRQINKVCSYFLIIVK